MKRSRTIALATGLAAFMSAPAIAGAAWNNGQVGNGGAIADSLGTPSSPSAGSATTSALTLSWTAPTGLAPGGYRVTRNGTDISTGGCGGTVSGTSCTDSGLSDNTEYTYTVRAVKGAWTGSATAGFKGKTLTLPALSFSSSSPSCSTGTVTLGANGGSWSTKVSLPAAASANVTITFSPTVSPSVVILAGQTESSQGGNGSPNNSGVAKFTLARSDANFTVTASATGYSSVSCTISH